jgi:hypothetical protein
VPALLWLVVIVGAPIEAPDDAPARPGEWGFRPLEGRVSATDPPAFVWRPQKEAVAYTLQVARDAGFQTLAYGAGGLRLHCHCPPRTLGPGVYHWRYRFRTKKDHVSPWSRVRSFRIGPGSVAFPMPAREELLARVPQGHPRLFFRPEDLPRLRELARGRLKDRWQAIVARCKRLLEEPPDVGEPLKYQKGEVAVTDGAATLAFAWLIGGDERYAKEARRLILAACAWDPQGATSYAYNDEAGMPFAYYTARTYTWLHGFLKEEERARIRAVMRVRKEQMYRHLAQGRQHIWRPYSSHANRAWHWLGEVATAFLGEVDGADDAAWFALNVFFCSYPVWNDDRGGWHEGLAYWNSYVGRVMSWLMTMRTSYGIDGFQKPFFRRAGDFALYVAPPGETMGGFGDLTLGYDAQRTRPLMTHLARMAGNPYWQWYVEEAGGSRSAGGYLGFLQGALPAVEAQPPRDVASSVLFSGVGVAVLHNDLVDRAKDVQLMLKSSPMGTQSHGYEAQNTFLLSVAGDPIFLRSGRRDLYGSPHHKRWMWETKSVNSVLVNGRGQETRSSRRLGEITRFSTSPTFDFVVGEAAPAYRGELKRFSRAVLFVKPEGIVIFDILEAKEPSTFQWLLHAPHEMKIEARSVVARGRRAQATLQILHPSDLEITQTNRFDPPPQEWVKLEQWHLTASTQKRRLDARFITVIRPHVAGAFAARPYVSDRALGCAFDVEGGTAFAIWRTHGRGPLELEGLRTDGDAAYVVLDGEGGVVRIDHAGGGSVSWKSGVPGR